MFLRGLWGLYLIVSTEITLLGFGIAKDTFINLAGLFGGFFPFIVDLIQRQNIEISKRTDLCKLFYFVKLVILPTCALIITAFATSSGNVTTWIAALYLGATFPVFAQKAVSMKPPGMDTKVGA
ncbi:hypothetical protein EZ55_00261 [Alteromonas macleodii]|nr:hypothetical protein EZ55_00261 [Alteromonas macleodii]VTP51759.1 hypothetical protein EZ55_00261 [Alteromonas macleodii]